ncbi:type VII secretion protein EccE [Tessaracoccus antarcticus]|uniref:Type VII secretion protein EccE n=1 Tax=Tessaracoccus antarcticus TaxID=2479848 RepID=A0A3M0GA30_9ACTN|nr:type VII secretion protein EccE [Tessaracoccus antarcticus]RMB61258.1 type VII secretion protein EccE [Tessaracoccus antarcticus]
MPAATQLNTARLPMRARSTRHIPKVLAWQVAMVVMLLFVATRTWWGVAAAAAVLLVAILLTVPVNGRSLWATMRVRGRFMARRRRLVESPDLPSELVPLGQWLPQLQVTQTRSAAGGEIGVVADGSSWAALLELTSDDVLIVDHGAELNLETLGELIQQDDILFAGIQVVTLTVPAPTAAMLTPDSPALSSYLEIVGGEPTPPAVRRTWIALRLDPQLCLEAVNRRGSGLAGVLATLRFGLHRAQATLKRQGVATRALDPLSIAEVLALASGATPQHAEGSRSAETWRQWSCDGLVHETRTISSYGSDPTANYQALLDSAAQCPAMMVLTSFTISPGQRARGAVRHVCHSEEQAAASDEELIPELAGRLSFGPLGGVQVPGMLATVPLGRQVES